MGFICVTNNNLIIKKYDDEFEILKIDGKLMDVMIKVRDLVQNGHKLLTHPLSGSVKPNETIIKTIFVSKKTGDLDFKSLQIIESSIEACNKFVKRDINYKNSRDDFEVVDMSLAESALISLSSY